MRYLKTMAAITDITRERIATTEAVIRPHIRRTPFVHADLADFGLAAPVTFKLEMLQHSGSFKARGAFANLLLRKVPEAGVVAASGGNHGVAVAYAAQRLGVPATIFVPDIVSPAKAERIRRYGAKLVITGNRIADAFVASEAHVESSGAMPVPPFDQAETILGQGSVSMELEQQVPDIDTLLVSVGGGGLIGGIAAWFSGRVRIIAVEPEQAPTLHAALAAGMPVDAPAGGIAGDSLAPPRVGRLTLPIARAHVEQALLVSEDAIRQAQAALWSVLRVVTEPGAATAFAPLLSGQYRPGPGERVAVVLTGANTTAVNFEG
jgi:threonine dehydratase